MVTAWSVFSFQFYGDN